MTSREFNQDLARAKRVARQEPVVVTDRGEPSHVLMSYADYEQLAGAVDSGADLMDRLAVDDDIDLEPVRMHVVPRVPDL